MKKIKTLALLMAGMICLVACENPGVYNNPTAATLPIEKKYQGNGSYAVDTTSFASRDNTIGKLLVAYPAGLTSTSEKWPLVMTCNPSNTSGEDMLPIMRHLASWGFVVVGNMDKQTGTGRTMSITLDELLAIIEVPGNMFHQKIDTTRIALMGFSQGAYGAVRAATKFDNSRRYRTVYLCSCPRPELGQGMGWDTCTFADFRVPVLMLAGCGKADATAISPLSDMQSNYALMPEGVPCAMGRRVGKDHDKMGGEGDPYMTAWFCHWLLGDTVAARAFCGPDAELLHNERWVDTEIKNMTTE